MLVNTPHHDVLRLPSRCPCRCGPRAALQAPVRPTVVPNTNTNTKSVTTVSNLRKVAVDDPSLQSTWNHRAWVAAGGASLLASLAKCISGSISTGHFLEPAATAFVGYLLADLGSGIYHWGIDNYGDASSPVFGAQIEAFQGHHRWPWTITKRQFANNLHALARAVMLGVVPFHVATDDPAVHAFVSTCGGCIMMSQQFHAWAHGTKSRLPPAVVALQDAGVLVSREVHGAHHRPPYNNNYCIVSGVWNEMLDRNRVFEAVELVLFFRFGVRPRSWSEPQEEWREEAHAHAHAAEEDGTST